MPTCSFLLAAGLLCWPQFAWFPGEIEHEDVIPSTCCCRSLPLPTWYRADQLNPIKWGGGEMAATLIPSRSRARQCWWGGRWRWCPCSRSECSASRAPGEAAPEAELLNSQGLSSTHASLPEKQGLGAFPSQPPAPLDTAPPQSSPAHLKTQALVWQPQLQQPAEPLQSQARLFIHRGATQILKKIFTRKRQSIIFHGETNTDGGKRALIRTAALLPDAFHPQISKCFNMTALSLFTEQEPRRNCTLREL